MKSLLATVIGLSTLAAGPGGHIAFVSGQAPETHCVCILDLATGVVVKVGQENYDASPEWSPDGQWLAFESGTENNRMIIVTSPDASEMKSPKHSAKVNSSPRWSPDGKKIAYVAGVAPKQRVVVYDMTTGTEKQWGGGAKGFMGATWIATDKFRDGGLLEKVDDDEAPFLILAVGFVEGEDGLSTDIFVVTPTSAVRLGDEILPSTGDYFEWNVQANMESGAIAFESNDGGDREIFVKTHRDETLDASNHRAADWNPVWSPNGKWLAFESFRGGQRGIYRFYPGTARVIPVADTKDADNWAPAWSSDGKWMAFVSNRTGNAEVFITEVDTGQTVQGTNFAGDDFAPCWRPEP